MFLDIIQQVERFAPLFLVTVLLLVACVAVIVRLRQGRWANVLLLVGLAMFAAYLTIRELRILELFTPLGDVVLRIGFLMVGLLLAATGFVAGVIQAAIRRRRAKKLPQYRRKFVDTTGLPIRYARPLEDAGTED